MGKSIKTRAKSYSYNRPSKGYQRNQAKRIMNEADIPKYDTAKLKRNLKIILALWIIGLAIDTWIEGLPGFVGMLLLGVILAFGVLAYIKRMDKNVIRAYKRMGVPKEDYLSEVKRQGLSEKRIDLISKLWDKTKEKKRDPQPHR